MNEYRSEQLRKWYTLLTFAAGSILTGFAARLGAPAPHGVSLPLGLLLAYWVLLGLTVGTWIALSRGWRALDRDARLRLALGYLAVTWGALIVISLDTPVTAVLTIAPGLGGLVVLAAYLLEGRQRRPDEGDIFP